MPAARRPDRQRHERGGRSSICRGLRVLVLEDEMIVGMLVEDMLTDLGCIVIGPAATVSAALRLVADGAARRRAPRRQSRPGRERLSGRDGTRRARAALRLRDGIRRRRAAGSLARPPHAAEAVPDGGAARRRRGARPRPPHSEAAELSLRPSPGCAAGRSPAPPPPPHRPARGIAADRSARRRRWACRSR